MTALAPIPDTPPTPARRPAVRAYLEKTGQVAPPSRWAASARWWCTEGLLRAAVVALKAPYLALRETPYLWTGARRLAALWVAWVSLADATVEKTEHHSESHARWCEQRRIGRRWITGITLFTCALLGWWALVRHPEWLALVGIAGVCLLDAVGRAVRPPQTRLPPPARALIKEGVPLSQVSARLVEIALREGLELGVLSPMRYDAARMQYEMTVTCLDAITNDHLRAFERGLGAADRSIHAYAPEDREATVRRLVIKQGDPLATVPHAPVLPTGSISITDRITLGVSVTETPFALKFPGGHIKVIGTTGSGKTAWFLRNAIAAVSAARDVVILGCDLSHGNEFSLWRGVVQRLARTEEETEALLDEILAEAARRGAILDGFAQDDDPTNDHLTEWAPELGPYWVLFIDEFHMVAGCDGRNGTPDLLGKVKTIIKTVRKFGIVLVMLTQETGNEDFGSKTMQTQATTAVALPCAPMDTVRLVGVERRDAGFQPHLLTPGTDDERHDAGKCYVSAPGMTAPDVYSCFAPMGPGEVKALARLRLADGLPAMYPPGHEVELLAEVAQVVDPLLAELDRAFGDEERLPSAALIEHLRDADPDLWGEMSPIRLADQLRPFGLRPKQLSMPDGRLLRGYERADLRSAIEQPEEPTA